MNYSTINLEYFSIFAAKISTIPHTVQVGKSICQLCDIVSEFFFRCQVNL